MNVCGNDFPPFDELQSFDLVIHCGACMFNRAARAEPDRRGAGGWSADH